MFEIYLDDETGHVLAAHNTVAAAAADVDRIGDLTMAQLAANGEGQEQFLLRLTVRDTETGEVVIRSGIFR